METKTVSQGRDGCTVTAASEVVFPIRKDYYHVRNDSENTVYASVFSAELDPAEDGVYAVPAGGNIAIKSHGSDRVYVSGGVTVIGTGSAVCPFKSAQRGGDITAKGNPVQIDGLQGGVPFSEMVVSGDNIIGQDLTVNVSGKNLLQKMTDKTIGGLHYSPNDDGSVSVTGTQTAENYPGITSTSGMLLKAGNYTLSGGTERLQITALDIDANTVIARAKIAPATFSIDNDKYIRIYVYSSHTYNSQTFDDVIYPQLELGDTATEYETPVSSTTTITPDTNPYTIPDDIRQQDGLNVVSVSEGELSVIGVQKNAAIKRIWDDMSMDLLFDGVTSADNPAVVNLANYNIIRIDVGGNFEGTSYFNCGSTYFSKSTLDFSFSSYGEVAMAMSNQAAVINISKSGADYSLSFKGFNTKQLIEVIKIYGIK